MSLSKCVVQSVHSRNGGCVHDRPLAKIQVITDRQPTCEIHNPLEQLRLLTVLVVLECVLTFFCDSPIQYIRLRPVGSSYTEHRVL